MIIKIYPDNPNIRHILQAVEVLRNGGLIIYPTDTIYGIGCDITCSKSVEKVAKLKGIQIEKSNFSIICHDLSHLSDYSKQIPNDVFKLMKRNLPGPFTFILEANSNVPKIFKHRKKTIGIRVPNNSIIREIIKELGNPIVSTSIRDDDDIIEYSTNPELIHEKFEDMVDLVVDGGFGGIEPSTIVDVTGIEPEIVRQGKGDLLF